jgi:hypothetical protein
VRPAVARGTLNKTARRGIGAGERKHQQPLRWSGRTAASRLLMYRHAVPSNTSSFVIRGCLVRIPASLSVTPMSASS